MDLWNAFTFRSVTPNNNEKKEDAPLTNFFASVGDMVSTIIEQEKNFYTNEQKIIAEKKERKLKSTQNSIGAPWENLPTEDTKIKEQVTLRILEIAKHQRNILDVPPDVISIFPFRMEKYVEMAKQTLDKDPQLAKLRYAIVPKYLTENNFWRNYFYRVHVIKSAFDLSEFKMPPSMEEQNNNGNEDKTNPNNLMQEKPTSIPSSIIQSNSMDQEKSVPEKPKNEEETKEGLEFASEYYDNNEPLDYMNFKDTLDHSYLNSTGDHNDDDLTLEAANILQSRPTILGD